MRTLLRNRILYGIVLLVVAVPILFIAVLKFPSYYVTPPDHSHTEWGVTFSKKYAEELELDWKEAYEALFADLGVTRVRIPVYWDDIETTRSSIDLTDYKYMLDFAQKRDAKVILAIGERLPRWPECHAPAWTHSISPEEKEAALFNMLEVVVKSFVEYDAISAWQIENEPLVSWFGNCDTSQPSLVDKEIAFVRTFDDRPVISTDSGEWGTWKKTYELGADNLGITTYRVVWNKWLGFLRLPFSPGYYRWKAEKAGIPWNKIISIEVQAEPWVPNTKGLIATPLEDQYASLSPEQFQANIDFVVSTEVAEAYLWGYEWWYWLRSNGNDDIWNIAHSLWKD